MGRTYQRVIDLLNEEVPAKISRNAFCKKTGINVNSFDRYKAGISEPTTATLEKLSKYFNVSVGELRGDVDDGWSFQQIMEQGRRIGKAYIGLELASGVKLDNGTLAMIGIRFADLASTFEGTKKDMQRVETAMWEIKKELVAPESVPPSETNRNQ
ncbi:MAG: helix-turn-helix transcriptional regulator [Geobacter sp.]|nr:helix-turn-helix transcriptional regulator [Geobacter sp.]